MARKDSGEMMLRGEDLEHPEDTSDFTDADWAALNGLRLAYKMGGQKALDAAVIKLGDEDVVQCSRMFGACYPDALREALKDAMAEKGMTREELQEMIAKAEGRDKRQ